MKMPIFTTFLIFVLWLTYELKKHSTDDKDVKNAFWAKEVEANNTRKKNIDHLPYITVPLSDFALDFPTDDDKIQEYRDTLRLLANKKILNLTGLSNTELKLMYGAPNITALSAYDQNFTTLVCTLTFLSEKYIGLGCIDEAKTILEYGISIGSDVRKNYELLAKIYADDGEFTKISELCAKAETLNSLSRDPILRSLDEIMTGEHCHTQPEVDP